MRLHDKMRPFQPGNSLGGRPRGARNKLARKFLEDCLADWQEHGAAAIRICRMEDPVAYCKMMASIVPRELEVTATAVAELDDTELDRMISTLRAQVAQNAELPMLTNGKDIDAEIIDNDRRS
jgi:hypothetical protein